MIVELIEYRLLKNIFQSIKQLNFTQFIILFQIVRPCANCSESVRQLIQQQQQQINQLQQQQQIIEQQYQQQIQIQLDEIEALRLRAQHRAQGLETLDAREDVVAHAADSAAAAAARPEEEDGS